MGVSALGDSIHTSAGGRAGPYKTSPSSVTAIGVAADAPPLATSAEASRSASAPGKLLPELPRIAFWTISAASRAPALVSTTGAAWQVESSVEKRRAWAP